MSDRRPDPNRPPADLDSPHRAVTAVRDQALLEWPWDRPATTVCADPRIPPPGQHVAANLSGPNAVVLSERAAAILQGFPEGWTFHGRTKRSRWSQLGQAMPPPLAHAVGTSVVEWFARAESWRPGSRRGGAVMTAPDSAAAALHRAADLHLDAVFVPALEVFP